MIPHGCCLSRFAPAACVALQDSAALNGLRLVSEANVELHRRIFDAFNERDIEALVAYLHPQFELRSKLAAVAPAVYHGHEGARRWH